MSGNALQRARLTAQLAAAVAELRALTAKDGLKRLQVTKRIIGLLSELGVQAPKSGLSPEEQSALKVLSDIAAGQWDSSALMLILETMEDAITKAGGADALRTELEQVAQAAITHWAKLEETSDV